ncbi:hypothetical protein PIB30_113191, partial [Stylosanthes scabra]|nr:hypothetical protein [Stylosanthes scabra]
AFKIKRSSWTLSISSPLSMSIRALEVARKGLPKIKAAFGSSSMSKITKSTGKKNFPTFTNTFSTIPCAY